MMVLDTVVSYDPHIVGSVLHNVHVVDISLGLPFLPNNVHDLDLDIHLFEHRVVGMEHVAVLHAALMEFDTLLVGVVGTVDTVEAVIIATPWIRPLKFIPVYLKFPITSFLICLC